MAESTFVDDDDVEDFKLTKKELAERFRVKTTKEDIDLAISGAIPEKTKRQTGWAFPVYEAWCVARDESASLAEMSASAMEEQLTRYRRQDGEPYPPTTLYGIVAGLQRCLRAAGRHEVSFLATTDPTFARLRLTLDARMKQLTSAGVGLSQIA